MQQLIQAINAFVSPQSKTEQVQEADNYLKQLERSKESWFLSIQVLEQSNQSNDVYFLAAKMLKSKMEYDFGQLNVQEQESLPQKLLEIMKIHKQSNRPVQGQLVDAFIFCYLHMYDRWPDFLEIIKQNFYQDPLMQTYIFMIFEYIPDNVFSKTIVMDDDHRDKMIVHFKDNLQKRIVEELNEIAKNEKVDDKSKYYLLKIMSNWIDFKTNSSILSLLQNHTVFNLALRSMNNDTLQQYSAKTIVAALRQMREEKEQLIYKDLFLYIANYVFGYFNDCKDAYNAQDFESVQNYSFVFSQFGNRAMAQFLNPHHIDQACQTFLLNMLEVSSFEGIDHEYEMSHFWNYFLVSIIKTKDASNKQALINQYVSLFEKLLNVGIVKTMYDQKIFQLFQEKKASKIDNMSEEFELKNKQRFHMKELVNTISNLIGAEQVIQYCAMQIQSNSMLEELGQNYPLVKAVQLESILSCINQVVFKAKREQSSQSNGQSNHQRLGDDSDDDNDYRQIFSDKSRSYIFEILTNVLKSKNPWIRLNRTIFSLIISSSDFLNQNLSVCQLAFDLIVTHLETPLLLDVSQSGFEVLCKDCPLFVQKNISTFLEQVYNKMMFNYQIVAGISYAICATDDFLNSHLISLCSPYANDIINYIKLPVEQQDNQDVINNLKKPLKAIKNIIQCVPEREQQGAFPHNILQEIFKQIWPVLKFIIENKSQNKSLIENIVSIIKQFITKMSVDFDIFFVEFLQQIIILYKATSQSGILYIVEKSVKIFSSSQYHDTFSPILQEAFEALVETTLQFIKTFNDFENHPDIVEDFYGFLGRFLKYFPHIYLQSKYLTNMLTSIQIGIKLQHKEAAKALFALIELLYETVDPRYIQRLQHILPLAEQLRNILLNQLTVQYNVLIFQELSEVPSKDVRQFIYDIFIAQVNCFGPISVNFFQPILHKLKEDICTQKEKEKFYYLLSQCTSKISREIENEVADFFILIGERFKKSYRRNN